MRNRWEGIDTDVQSLIRRVLEQPDRDFPLYDVWQHLIQGRWSAVGAACDDAACYLVLRELSPDRPPVRPHQLRVLERMLQGYGQKFLAADMGVACSTIASTAKQALACIGVECLPSRVPLALVLIARASQDRKKALCGALSSFTRGNEPHFLVGLPRPDLHLDGLLSPAEVEVLKARLEGQSHQRIARLRRTSQRTIANQLASASRRLGVSGRLEIIGHLSQHAQVATLN